MRRAKLLLFAAGTLCAQTHEPAGSIHGVVKDEATGKPIPDAYVQVGHIQVFAGEGVTVAINGALTTTDDEGHYTFASVAPGTRRVTAGERKGPGLSRTVQVADGQDLAVDFLIPSTPTIAGRVVDENREPVVDAFVWLIRSDYQAGVLRRGKIGPEITRSDGTFNFDKGLEAGRGYYLLVDRPTPEGADAHKPLPLDERQPIEAPTYYGDATSLEAATPIRLLPGEHREAIEVKIRKASTYCVDGIIQISGEPSSASLVIEEAALDGTELARVRIDADEDGTFRVCDLTPGQYAIRWIGAPVRMNFAIANSDVQHIRFNVDNAMLHLQLAWDGDPPGPSKSEPPRIAQGAFAITPSTADDKSEFQRGMAAAARAFKGDDGNQISVELEPAGSGSVKGKSMPAPYDGPFSVPLAAGDYAIRVRLAPGSYVKELSYDGVVVTDGILHLSPGVSGTLRVVASQGSGTVTGTVADADGHPMADANVVLIPENVNSAALLSVLAKREQSDSNGSFRWENLAPGNYRAVALNRPVRLIPEDLDKLLLLRSSSQSVEVGANAKIQVKLQPLTVE